MEIEIKKYISVTDVDFLNTDNLIDVNLKGDLIFKEISINNINENSNIMKELNIILNEQKIDKTKYDIFFLRNKEWFNKFIFYKKNE